MKQLLSRVLAFLVFLVVGHHALPAAPPASSSSSPQSIDTQVQSFAPPGVLRLLKDPSDLQYDYVPADLDGTGSYNYLVATYGVGTDSSKVRVLRNISGKLQLAGVFDPTSTIDFVGFPTTVQLVYVDNSGIPAVEVMNSGVDGRHFGFNLLKWTGSALTGMFPHEVSMVDSYFADPQGTGVPEVINPPYCDRGECEGEFEVYQLRDGMYKRTATFSIDPSGLIPPSGENLPLPDVVMMQPSEFSVAEILSGSRTRDTGAAVVVKFGNLAPIDSKATRTDVADVNLGSIYAGRNVKPSRVEIIGAAKSKAEGFDGPSIEIVLPRSNVLQYLAKAQPSKPPSQGDVVMLPVHARLKNGLALYGFAAVHIVGSPSK